MRESRYTFDRPRIVGDDDGSEPIYVLALGVGFGFRKDQTGWIAGTLVYEALNRRLFARIEPAAPGEPDEPGEPLTARSPDDDVDAGHTPAAPAAAARPAAARGRRPARPTDAG